MNGRFVRIEKMTCNCGVSIEYNAECNVSFVDTHRALKSFCGCNQLEGVEE